MPFTGSGSDLSNGAKGRNGFYWCLFFFCFYFEPVKIEGMTLPGVAETMDVEQDNRLPKLDVPNAIQQKVIPGKREGGYMQHESTSEEIMSPFSPWGNLRDIGQSLQL